MRVFRRPWANPLVQFVVAALLLFALTWWATGVLSRKAGKTEAIADARVTTELLGLGMAEPAIPRKMIEGDAGAVDRFDRRVGRRMFHVDPDLRTVKIWRSDGTIVYSNNTKLIGKKFKLDAEQRDVLENGATEGSLSDLRRAENKFETEEDGLLEVYTQIHSPEGQPLLFEGYYKVETVKQRAAEVRSPFRKITAGGLGAVLLIGLPLIGLLTLRLTRASRAR